MWGVKQGLRVFNGLGPCLFYVNELHLLLGEKVQRIAPLERFSSSATGSNSNLQSVIMHLKQYSILNLSFNS